MLHAIIEPNIERTEGEKKFFCTTQIYKWNGYGFPGTISMKFTTNLYFNKIKNGVSRFLKFDSWPRQRWTKVYRIQNTNAEV